MGSYFRNPVISQPGADHGDPFVINYLGRYYLYHTGRTGVHAYTSTDLVHWNYEGTVLSPCGGEHWAEVEYWAPEVLYIDGVFYMYVSGTRKTPQGRGDDQLRRLGIARSRHPLGPFQWDSQPLFDEWSIDAHPFKDENGALWMFYNIRTDATRYIDGTVGCGNVVEAMLAPDRAAGNQTRVAFPTERWEGDREGTWYWNEGPWVLKRRNWYYQLYSGGCYRDETYSLGLAFAPSPIGPWTKYEKNPIYTSTAAIIGPGHNSVVLGPDGVSLYCVYHGRIPGDTGRKVHIDRLFWVGDHLEILGPTDGDQPMPPGPVYDPRVSHWKASAWVRGSKVEVCGIFLSLTTGGYHHLQASYSAGLVRVHLDGEEKYAGEALDDVFLSVCDGAVEGLMQTSCLEDANIYELPCGREKTWRFGSRGPVELAIAVRGGLRLYADDVLIWEGHTDAFSLVRSTLPGGLRELKVVSQQHGTSVTDLLLIAR
ncbi:MAG TPA: family 43 glycosylhydrolase [Firmicutes bacterium]|nr:family 43 glycosylhydrolase [Bacillota bacterium]